MRQNPPSSPALLMAVVLGAVPLASALQDADALEGHSGHGEAFNEGPRQAAYLMPLPGSIDFPVTTSEPAVQDWFHQGVGHLHGFWYLEAERTFRQIASMDPDCAMAYWGMAMANSEAPERATRFARVAWLKRGLVSEREQLYIDMVARFYQVEGPEEPQAIIDLDERAAARAAAEEAGKPAPKEKLSSEEEKKRKDQKKKRHRRMVEDYEELIWEYPDDIEAKALLATHLWTGRYAGLETQSRMAIEGLLAHVFAAQPMHPAHHYRIHLWDSKETAGRVVDSAWKAGHSWPNIAHMWHMGGHIFDKLGRFSDAAWQQEASARVDHAHMMRDWVLPDQIHNFAHNNEWLTRSLRHHGRMSTSVTLAKNMIELPRHPKYNTLEKRGCSSSYGRQRLLETLELYEQWDELIALADTMYLQREDRAVDSGLRAFVLGKAHAFRGNEGGLDTVLCDLEELIDEAQTERGERLAEAEEELWEEEGAGADTREALDGILKDTTQDIGTLRKHVAALTALAALLAGEELEQNLEALEKAHFDKAQLARLAFMLGLEHDNNKLQKRAKELARESIKGKQGQLPYYANAAWVLYSSGEEDEGLDLFDELREWSAYAELSLPVMRRLAPLAAARELTPDWRVAPETPADVGERPDLDTLGPRRWTPVTAPAWSCPDGFGEEVALADFEGRPLIVIFFLGFGCVHCVEQLVEFSPVAEEFRKAGIELVAIGDDSPDELASSRTGRSEEEAYDFVILSDEEHEHFKSYRAFDDFEEAPLHGTFLIDGQGRVRWQDVSFEPFMDWEFLLAESQRLLGLDEQPPARAATGSSQVGDRRSPATSSRQ